MLSEVASPRAALHAMPKVEIRCPNKQCNTVFVVARGIIDPKPTDPAVELECLCKNRRCKRLFTVRIGVV